MLPRVPITAPGSNPMRKPIPLRWIEEQEARRVLATAQSDAPPAPYAPVAAKATWRKRVRQWVATPPSGVSVEASTVPGAAAEPRRS